MMILSRIWYVILAILLAAAYYVVALAVGQYNRRNQVAMDETIKADSQVVNWALQVDARRRLDGLLLAAVDPAIGKALRGANGKEAIPAGSKEEAAKRLREFNEKLPPEYKNDAMFVTDREGRLVAQIGYDAANSTAEFELGGYPAVFDALHGYLRDDTWVWNGKIARVVTRPVEDEVGQPPLGAVVALKWVDAAFTKQVATRTRTNLSFFALGAHVASSVTTEGFEERSLEGMANELKALADDKGFKEGGRTDVKPLNDTGGVLFVRLPGDASELNAGFAVARPKVSIANPLGFIDGADDQDKKSVKLWIVALVVVGAAFFGLLFSYLEHSSPQKEMALQADKLKKGEIDVLHLPKFRGGLRAIASDINAGIQRVVEKGGGTARKPADLESILGPVPAQPNMSAFSFPMADGSGAPQQAPASNPAAFGAPAAAPPSAQRFHPPPSAGGPPSPNPSRPNPALPVAPSSGHLDRTVALGNAPPPPPFPGNAANRMAQAPTAPAGFPTPNAGIKPMVEKEDEQTMVAQPSADLIAATGAHAAAGSDPTAEWQGVYEEFIKTKRECGEPTDGLTFEKFKQTLTKNRDALMQRHGCKRVKFSVYVKEGRASLKATPVRD